MCYYRVIIKWTMSVSSIHLAFKILCLCRHRNLLLVWMSSDLSWALVTLFNQWPIISRTRKIYVIGLFWHHQKLLVWENMGIAISYRSHFEHDNFFSSPTSIEDIPSIHHFLCWMYLLIWILLMYMHFQLTFFLARELLVSGFVGLL